MAAGALRVRVAAAEPAAASVRRIELRAEDGGALPSFTAGAHIDLQLPGMIRSYSLVNAQDERDRYVIAVNLDPRSRGGSRFLHEELREGAVLDIRGPRNNFPLEESAGTSLLIAGGIGITPLWCMIQRLEALGRDWRLVYCARTRRHAAFVTELESFGPRVRFHFDGEPGGTQLDLAALVDSAAPGTHLYCCGPVSMLQAFEKATAGRPAPEVHVEYFSAAQPRAVEGGYTVVLQRSGLQFEVPPGKTIMDTLIAHGFEAPYSCLEGVCGTCETRVIEGLPDHRDLVLSKNEREANRTIMICCSGSRTARLVLDL